MNSHTRSVIADKILKISKGKETPLSLCQDAVVPYQQITLQNPQINYAIQGMINQKHKTLTTILSLIVKKPLLVWLVCLISLRLAARD